jgi:hypothetical protein
VATVHSNIRTLTERNIQRLVKPWQYKHYYEAHGLISTCLRRLSTFSYCHDTLSYAPKAGTRLADVIKEMARWLSSTPHSVHIPSETRSAHTLAGIIQRVISVSISHDPLWCRHGYQLLSNARWTALSFCRKDGGGPKMQSAYQYVFFSFHLLFSYQIKSTSL